MRSPLEPARDLEPFFELRSIPVFCNVLHDSAASARAAPRGDLALGVCTETGFVFNAAFDPALVAYSPDYESSLHFSPHFLDWARGIADELAPGLEGELVVEVGCGKGEFLRELTERARCRAIGFDQSVPDAETVRFESGGVLELRDEFLDVRGSELAPALLLNRHVLEHVEDPLDMLRGFRELLSHAPSGRLYLEVPNALWTLEKLGVWDLIYEHCGYFSPVALRAALTRAGFVVDELRADYGEQYLVAFARPSDEVPPHASDADTTAVDHVVDLARTFEARFGALTDEANARLDRALSGGSRVVIWGAGSKGVMLLNLLERGDDVAAAVDKNPRKVGKHIAGTGHEIVLPERLRELRPDVVLVANPLYAREIEVECRELGVDARVETI